MVTIGDMKKAIRYRPKYQPLCLKSTLSTHKTMPTTYTPTKHMPVENPAISSISIFTDKATSARQKAFRMQNNLIIIYSQMLK